MKCNLLKWSTFICLLFALSSPPTTVLFIRENKMKHLIFGCYLRSTTAALCHRHHHHQCAQRRWSVKGDEEDRRTGIEGDDRKEVRFESHVREEWGKREINVYCGDRGGNYNAPKSKYSLQQTWCSLFIIILNIYQYFFI